MPRQSIHVFVLQSGASRALCPPMAGTRIVITYKNPRFARILPSLHFGEMQTMCFLSRLIEPPHHLIPTTSTFSNG